MNVYSIHTQSYVESTCMVPFPAAKGSNDYLHFPQPREPYVHELEHRATQEAKVSVDTIVQDSESEDVLLHCPAQGSYTKETAIE
jgi:hypothetical protein